MEGQTLEPAVFAPIFGQGILFEEASPWPFIILTLALGGICAWMAGRALARGWRPIWRVVLYMALFGFAIRFLHWGLGSGTLRSWHYYAVDTLVLVLVALLAYQVTRTGQMVRQYHWLYRRTSPISWTSR